MTKKSFVGLSVGSSKIRAIVAENGAKEKTTIVGVFEAPSYGFKKGKVVDFNEVVQSVGRVLSERRHVAISVFEARVEAGEISVVLRLGELTWK